MQSKDLSWILVEGSSPAAIQKAVLDHSRLARHIVPSVHRVSVFQLEENRHGVFFEPPLPPYAFTNLIGWLDDPKMTAGAGGAVGWLSAPGDGTRYFLAPQRRNAGGDTLLGVSAEGRGISVYLPDCSVSRTPRHILPTLEPAVSLQDASPIEVFEITVDADRSFGNPEFVVG